MMYYLERIIISSIVWLINYCRTIIWIVVKDSVKSLLLRLFYLHRTSLDMAPSSFSVLKKLKMRRWKQSWYLSTEIEEHAHILNLNDKAQLRNGIRWIRVSTFSMCEASKLGDTYVDLCSVNKLRHVQAWTHLTSESRLRRREPWPFVAPEARSLLVFTSADPGKTPTESCNPPKLRRLSVFSGGSTGRPKGKAANKGSTLCVARTVFR